MYFSVRQHEIKVHRDRTSRKAACERRLENAFVAALGEFERRNGVAVFLFRGGHPIPYRRKALKALTFVVYDRIRSKAVRHCFERAGIGSGSRIDIALLFRTGRAFRPVLTVSIALIKR